MVQREGWSTAEHLDPVRALFDAEYLPMVRLAGAMLGSRAAAEEAVQDAFVQVSRTLDTVAPDKRGAYLRTAVLNAARTQVRRSRAAKRQARAVPELVATPEEHALRSAEAREVMALVDTLPERQRQCLVLRYFEGLTDPEVAEALGISMGSVKSHIHRALETLRTKGLAR